jgi:hypothetical protein
MRVCILCFILSCGISAVAQDSTITVDKKIITLKEVIVRSNLNVPRFIRQVKEDTTFYKAFKNLRVLGYTALNNVSMFNKNGGVSASLASKTIQHVSNGCRWMETRDETTTGDIYTKKKEFNYYTAEMYAGLFFARDTICGENSIVAGTDFTARGKTGFSKHKEQLKMLFFNPGRKIPGIPFIGNKIAIFEEPAADLYDFVIDMEERKGTMCYVFRIVPRADLGNSDKNDIVINEMTTWFNIENWEITARNYHLSYRAGVYDFDIRMEVEMAHFENLLVPVLITYHGNWDVMLKKRERGVFTATMYDFKRAQE